MTRLVSPGSIALTGHVEARRRDVQAREQDERLDSPRVDTGLLRRLADRRPRRPCVASLPRPAGKRDLARVVAKIGRPLLQEDVGSVSTVGRDQDQNRGLPLGGRAGFRIVAAQLFWASRGNRAHQARQRRRYDGWPEIALRQPAGKVGTGRREVHIRSLTDPVTKPVRVKRKLADQTFV
jgi:hypothetical protein